MKKVVLFLVILYKKYISPYFWGSCKFYPSCSDYFGESVENFGVLRGSLYGFMRLLRCNPFSKGGFDPVKKEGKKLD